jgi:hypothetical protein
MGLQARMVGADPGARVFLADALDNGAGHAVELGRPRVFANILNRTRQELTAAWEDPLHPHYAQSRAQTACGPMTTGGCTGP